MPDYLGQAFLTAPAGTGVIRGRSLGGQVAQLVEQRTENPRVGGSIPPLATTSSLNFNDIFIEQFQEARRVCQECAMDLRMSGIGREMIRGQMRVAPHHTLRFPTSELL